MEFIAQCQTIAQKHFAIQNLRSAQIEVFSLISEKKFVLATLPTGSGKTLLYAVPSLIFNEGPVVVISPLISLMRDQLRRMEEAKIPCVIFTSEQNEIERKKSHNNLWNMETKIIFLSPERFVLPSFFKKLMQLKPGMVVIDEAHCVISWGHQFRPEYSEIGKYLELLNPKRVLAITATASGITRQEMIKKIFPEHTNVAQFVSNPIGKHIFVKSVRAFSFEEQKERLLEILSATPSEKSIVYFPTRKQCEEFSFLIKSKKKLNAVVYHAGLSKESRSQMETYIHQTKQKTVVCATTAFGLGIDISNVALVVVYGFPSNIEEFLQMIGRAGRSGQKSCGILLWTGSDPVKRGHQFKELFPLPSVFFEQCQKIRAFFPKSGFESQFVLKEHILNAVFSMQKYKNREKLLEGFLGALRVCHAIKEILPHEDYYHIKFADETTIHTILGMLPKTTTKRQMVFLGLKMILPKSVLDTPAASVVISATELFHATELALQSIEEVFSHYTTQKSLSFVKITSNQAKYGVILQCGFQMLQNNLNYYIKARHHFYSSLQQLKKLAEAPRCRLESGFSYFEVPMKSFCLQCDLCQHYKRV